MSKKLRTCKPIRVTPRKAAELLSIHYETLRGLIRVGIFTVVAPYGRGVGKRTYLLMSEVEAFGREGVEAVKALQSRTRKK